MSGRDLYKQCVGERRSPEAMWKLIHDLEENAWKLQAERERSTDESLWQHNEESLTSLGYELYWARRAQRVLWRLHAQHQPAQD